VLLNTEPTSQMSTDLLVYTLLRYMSC